MLPMVDRAYNLPTVFPESDSDEILSFAAYGRTKPSATLAGAKRKRDERTAFTSSPVFIAATDPSTTSFAKIVTETRAPAMKMTDARTETFGLLSASFPPYQ